MNFIRRLGEKCREEEAAKQQLINDAQGSFFLDTEKMRRVRFDMETKSCRVRSIPTLEKWLSFSEWGNLNSCPPSYNND
jgi:Domain of unknown function (DUF1977)